MARLNPVRLPRLDSRASPAAFGAGRSIESFGGGAGPEAYGAGLISPGVAPPGTLGRDLQQLGQIFQGVAETALTVMQRDAVITARRNALAAGVEWDKRLLDAKQASPADAADFTKNFMGGFEEYRRKTIEGLSGTELRIMEDELTQLGGSLYRESVNFESSQRLKAREADAKATVEIARNAVFARPDDHGRILGGLLADIEASDLPEFAKQEIATSTTAALAESLWSARVERDPYASKRALTEGDSASLNGLEFQDRQTLLNRADVEINRREAEQRAREAEARARANEARQERQFWARFTFDDAVAAAERGETLSSDVDRTLVDAFGARAAPMLQQLHRIRETAAIAGEFGTMSPGEISDAIAGKAPDGSGYKIEADTQDKMVGAAQRVLEARRRDPAAAVATSYPNVAAGLASDDPAAVGQALRQSYAIQGETFQLPPDQRRVLTPGLKDTIVSEFKGAATADERLSLLQRYTTGLRDDETARQVLSELEQAGLPADARLSMERYAQGDITGAREILGGLTTKPGDLPKLAETKTNDIATAVDARMADPSGTAGLSTYRANLSRQPGMFQRSAGERDAFLRLTTQYVAAGEDPESAADRAQTAIYGTGKVAGSDDLGYVEAPSTVDPDALTTALERARETVDLTGYAPTQRPTRPGQEATGAQVQEQDFADRDYQRWADSIRNGGLWTDADGGYALLEPTTGRRVAFFTVEQLLTMQGQQ